MGSMNGFIFIAAGEEEVLHVLKILTTQTFHFLQYSTLQGPLSLFTTSAFLCTIMHA